MRHDSDVQSSADRLSHERFWGEVSDPTDTAGEITERITLDILLADFEFLKQDALFRNALSKQNLAKQSGTRKAMAAYAAKASAWEKKNNQQ